MIKHYVRLGLVPAYLLLCLILGGASAGGFWGNMGLQLIAIPIIVWALAAKRSAPMAPSARQLVVLLVLSILWVVLQLVPLPPSIWTQLPGREPIARGFELLGQPTPWMPISLAPYKSVSSALWLLPAVAVLLGILRLGNFKSNWIAWTIVAVAIVSVVIGGLQLVGGKGSPWYFYQVTNYGSTTGFFSNANHFATLLVVTLPFLAALYLTGRSRGGSIQRSSGLFVLLAGAVAVVFVGIGTNRSIAGLGLSVPVLAGSALMILSRKRRLPAWSAGIVLVLVLGSIALAFSAPFQNNLTGEEARGTQSSRYTSFTRSLDATADYLPLGSGVGTFPEIYPQYEDPNVVNRFYMNHVHGDYIELALETGVPGVILILLFLIWWLRRAIGVWRSDEPDYFARAATIASAAILAHSVVDYPLRTAAVSALLAMSCALMAEPRARTKRRRASETEPVAQARHLDAD